MKLHTKQLFLIIASIILSFFVIQKDLRDTNYFQNNNNQVLADESPKQIFDVPLKIMIPIIEVNAKIQNVGVNSKGEMETPSNTADVGWFSPGPLPGEMGSAVIAGHLDGESNENGVFMNLHRLKKGDIVRVSYQSGAIVTFEVRGSKILNPGYAEEVFSKNDKAHLNLVTCDGTWDGVKKHLQSAWLYTQTL